MDNKVKRYPEFDDPEEMDDGKVEHNYHIFGVSEKTDDGSDEEEKWRLFEAGEDRYDELMADAESIKREIVERLSLFIEEELPDLLSSKIAESVYEVCTPYYSRTIARDLERPVKEELFSRFQKPIREEVARDIENIREKLRGEMIDGVKNELKEELRGQVKEELKADLLNKIKGTL